MSYQVIAHTPGPRWEPATPFREQPGVADHIATMRGWLDTGRLLIGGPFLDAGGGGMAIVSFADVSAADDAAQADPSVQAGLLVATTRPWLAGMSRFDLA